jgi:hypothetical protein
MKKHSNNNTELSDVICRFGKELMEQNTLSPQQIKVLNNIVNCRTSILGGHEQVCESCGVVEYSYNSCRDRHCPKCLAGKQQKWVQKLIEDTLPVPHYHIIFTVPHELNRIYLWNTELYCDILFSAVKRTLHSFGYTHYGCETGAVAVLHTWGQNLWLHPHIHCLVPAAGYSLDGKWRRIGKGQKFLYSGSQLGKAYKDKLLKSLKSQLRKMGAFEGFKSDIDRVWTKKWVVLSEASMAGPERVIRYLGQYTHRIAISNKRILSMSQTHVTFIAKDYRDRAKPKPVSLTGVEFLKRFCQHVMPVGYVRIRRFGIYHHTTKQNLDLQFVDEKPDIDKMIEAVKKKERHESAPSQYAIDATICKHCKNGHFVVIKHLPRIRSPAGHLPSIFLKALL